MKIQKNSSQRNMTGVRHTQSVFSLQSLKATAHPAMPQQFYQLSRTASANKLKNQSDSQPKKFSAVTRVILDAMVVMPQEHSTGENVRASFQSHVIHTMVAAKMPQNVSPKNISTLTNADKITYSIRQQIIAWLRMSKVSKERFSKTVLLSHK